MVRWSAFLLVLIYFLNWSRFFLIGNIDIFDSILYDVINSSTDDLFYSFEV